MNWLYEKSFHNWFVVLIILCWCVLFVEIKQHHARSQSEPTRGEEDRP